MLQNWFGQAVRTIVEGETKFSKIGQLSEDGISSAELKARDLQHLFLAMTKEVGILPIEAERVVCRIGSVQIPIRRLCSEQAEVAVYKLRKLVSAVSQRDRDGP